MDGEKLGLLEKLRIIEPGNTPEEVNFGLDNFRNEFEKILAKKFKQAITIERIPSLDEVFKKYRKNTYAAVVEPIGYLTDKHRFEKPMMAIKTYKDSSERDFMSDLQLAYALYHATELDFREIDEHRFTGLSDARRKISGFLNPWSYESKYCTDRKMVITDFSQNAPLYARFAKNRPQNFWGFVSALDLPIFLHDRVPSYATKIPKLKEILAKPISMKEYARSFNSILQASANLTKEEKAELSGNFDSVVKTCLLQKDMETLIQYDGYPWQNDTSCFLDIGTLRRGARGMHLGALLGTPSIFNSIENFESNLHILLIESYDKFKRYELGIQFPSSLLGPYKPFDEDNLKNSFYAGAVCANSNILVEQAPRLEKEEMMELESVMATQLKMLRKAKVPGASEICKFIEAKPMQSWNYFENLAERERLMESQRAQKSMGEGGSEK